MLLTINAPDIVKDDNVHEIISEIEKIFKQRGISCTIDKDIHSELDPWSTLDIERIAVDTGIPDFSINHDHYLYGTEKIR